MRIDDKYKWLARDEDGKLLAYEDKPYKGGVFWDVIGSDGEYNDIEETDDTYSFVKWNDEEPFAINRKPIVGFNEQSNPQIDVVNFRTESEVYKQLRREGMTTKNALRAMYSDELKPEPTECEPQSEQTNNITKPSHYIGIHGLEVEEVTRNFLPRYTDGYVSHRVGSALEYLLRSPLKNELEDIKKAKRNLEQVIAYEESKIKPEEVVEEPESVKQPTDDHLTEFLAFLRGIKVTEDKNMEKVSTFYHGYNLND